MSVPRATASRAAALIPSNSSASLDGLTPGLLELALAVAAALHLDLHRGRHGRGHRLGLHLEVPVPARSELHQRRRHAGRGQHPGGAVIARLPPLPVAAHPVEAADEEDLLAV